MIQLGGANRHGQMRRISDSSLKNTIADHGDRGQKMFGGLASGENRVDSRQAETQLISSVIRRSGDVAVMVGIRPHPEPPGSSYQADLVETTWFRQAALFHRHRIPVLTVLVLLRREANSPGLTGQFEIRLPDGLVANQYNYRVVRIWQEDPETYLTSGVNLVPLAPLTNVTEKALPEVVQRMADRINVEPEPRAATL